MAKEPKKIKEQTAEERLIRNSEIRNGEFVRYYGKDAEIVIPDGVTMISEDAFRGNLYLTSLTIGKNVLTISESAFRDCAN